MIPGNATPIQGGLGYCWQTVFGKTGLKRYEPTHGFRAILSLVYLVASFRHFGNVPGGSAAHGGQPTLPTQPPYHHRRYVRLLRAAATSHSTLPSCPFREATGPLYCPCGVRTAMIADDDAGMLCTPARPPHGLDAAGLANIQQKLKCVSPSRPHHQHEIACCRFLPATHHMSHHGVPDATTPVQLHPATAGAESSATPPLIRPRAPCRVLVDGLKCSICLGVLKAPTMTKCACRERTTHFSNRRRPQACCHGPLDPQPRPSFTVVFYLALVTLRHWRHQPLH